MTTTLDASPTTYVGRPRYEGANIRTWIGFKHFTYLLEEAVLQHFRDRGTGPDVLYHVHGLGIEFVETSIQLPATLLVDDEVTAVVTTAPAKPGQGAAFKVRLSVQRDGAEVTILTGKVRVALVAEQDAPGHEPVPVELVPYVVGGVAELETKAREDLACTGEVTDVLTPPGSNAFLWSWRIPYFYCHYSHRLQHSGYTRALEEVVDRFLHERGLGIGKLLEERGWIPVVSRARVQLLADAQMEETLHTVFTVGEIIKDVMYTARMDTYVRRGDVLVHTATASIVHGYAVSRGEKAGSLAEFDADTLTALLGGAE
ncbi:thioesterase [Actinosynnema sp. NPDC023658]|uniref:thioesterase n=1 Tax=Actinosynnema sp. NPDC023658 TaxID=3155465 RepID=UPI0033CC3CF0